MKTLQLTVLLIISLSSHLIIAQETACERELPYTSLEEALAEPEKVIYLDLAMQHPKLTTIPKEVALFPNLVCLDVSFNRISTIPAAIKACTKLKVLNLAGNRYLGSLPIVLKDVPSLEQVDVTDIPEWNAQKRAEAKALLPNTNVLTD